MASAPRQRTRCLPSVSRGGRKGGQRGTRRSGGNEAAATSRPFIAPPPPPLSHQLNHVTYTLSASEATLRNQRALTGAWVSASTPVGDGVVGSVAFDLGARTSSAALTAARTVAGMPVDLGARWAEKGSAWRGRSSP